MRLHRKLILAVPALAGVAMLALPGRGHHGDPAPGGTVGGAAVVATKARGRLLDHAHPMMRGGHRLARRGHRFREWIVDHGQPDAEAPDGNTPFGNFWWVGASSTQTSAIPNSGVRMEADVITVPAAAAGGCFSVWTSDVLSNDMWGQIGYSACDLPGQPFYDLTAFFQVWDLSEGPDGTILVDQESSRITPGLHSFAMYAESGTTWRYTVDDSELGAIDMGSATGDAPFGVTTLSEEGDGVTAAFEPPAVAVPVAMEVLSGGTWSPAPTAIVVNTAGLSGVSGHLQDPGLADDQIVIGGTSPTLDSGVSLWDGVATDGGLSQVSDAGTLSETFLQVTCPVPNATVGGTVVMGIHATSPPGIASVTVTVDAATDPNGGSAVVLCNLTAAPYTCDWDTSGAADGAYFVDVSVTDGQGGVTYEDFVVNVSQSAPSPCSEVRDAGTDGAGGADAAGGVDATAPGNDGATPAPDGSGEGSPGVDAASDAGGGSGSPSSTSCSCDAIGSGSGSSGFGFLLALLGLAARARPSRRRKRHLL